MASLPHLPTICKDNSKMLLSMNTKLYINTKCANNEDALILITINH